MPFLDIIHDQAPLLPRAFVKDERIAARAWLLMGLTGPRMNSSLLGACDARAPRA